jgi:hypothetical protein
MFGISNEVENSFNECRIDKVQCCRHIHSPFRLNTDRLLNLTNNNCELILGEAGDFHWNVSKL